MSRRFKDRLFGELARVSKAVASPHRLEIIELLAQGERPVEGVASALSMPVANASHHLRALHAARLVDSRREGTFIHYRLADPLVFELVRTVRTLAERRLGEVERIARSYFDSRDQLEPVAREDLLDRVRQGDVIVLDVRPAAEYRAGHIDGAISIPTTELEHRLEELPSGKEIVAYCRGPYCVMAVEAVVLLRARGRKARRLADGYPEWQAAGLPTRTPRSAA
jgi:rhodanese-related sulfurtransferase/DNA-binding transcriptional ArsR family regulator